MSKQEVLALLLPYYKEHLEVVKGMDHVYEALGYMEDKAIHFGLCKCALRVFGVDIYGTAWMNAAVQSRGRSLSLANNPGNCSTIDKIVEALQTRIDIMESLLQTPETTNA